MDKMTIGDAQALSGSGIGVVGNGDGHVLVIQVPRKQHVLSPTGEVVSSTDEWMRTGPEQQEELRKSYLDQYGN